ncbi:hypothetical protein K1719_025817 [Acacia pycnantha]|nr:hypothetical protein K1719_025817 [Acacia pycnantha]
MQVWELQKPPLLHYLKQGAWKEVEFRFNDTVGLSSESVTVNGVMFWWMSKRFGEDTDDEDENLIVSFDLAVEVFTVIPLPELQPIKLTVYEEKLAIFSSNRNSKHPAIDMWVMEEEGVGASGERWGFGFSPIINGYKIVMTYASEYKVKLSGLKVYSLSSDSWKEVKFRLNDTACVRSQSVTVNGVMFWLGSKIVGEDTDDQMVIVSFGLAMEVLTLIPIPDP